MEKSYKALVWIVFLSAIHVASAAPSFVVDSPFGSYPYSGYIDLNYSVSDALVVSDCWYSLNSGTNVSPAGNNAYSANFSSAATQFLSVDDTAATSITGNLTIESWVKFNSLPASDGTFYIIASKYRGVDNNKEYLFMLYNYLNTHQLRYYNSNNGVAFLNSSISFEPTLGVWYHVAVVYDASSSSASFYVDGKPLGEGAGAVFSSNYDGAAQFSIGSMFKSDGAPWGLFDGKMDEVRLWNYSRTADQIKRNYNHELTGYEIGLNGYWKLNDLSDSSIYGQTLFNNNSVAFSSNLPFPVHYHPASIKFNSASSQYVAVSDNPSVSITGDFTVEAMVNFTNLPSSGNRYVIAGRWNGLGYNKAFVFDLYNNSGTYQLDFFASKDGNEQNETTVNWATPVKGTWYMLSAAYDASAGTVTFYSNGDLIGTGSKLPTSIYDGTSPFFAGAVYGGSGTPILPGNEQIDELRLWNTCRTATEIALYNGTELTGNESNLAGYWKFDGNLQDETNNSNDFTSYGSSFSYGTSSMTKLSTVSTSCVNSYLNVSEGSHNLRMYANDSLNSLTTTLVSFISDLTDPVVNFSGGTLPNGTEVVQDWIFANVSVVELNEQNITFSLFNDTGLIDVTYAGSEYSNINWTNRPPGMYYYNVSVNDSAGHLSSTETRTVILTSATATEPTSSGGSSQGAAAIVVKKENVTKNLIDEAISDNYTPAPCSITHIGECFYPKEPIVGWIIFAAIIWFMYSQVKQK